MMVAERRVLLHARRVHGAEVHAEDVVPDHHLPVAVGAGAARDRGDRELLGDAPPQRRRHHLERHREGARLLEGDGVVEDLLGLRGGIAPHHEPAEAVDGLGDLAHVAHDGDPRVDDGLDGRVGVPASLHLHRGRPAFLEEATGAADGLGNGRLVGEERHVGHEQRAHAGAGHRLHVVQDLVERHVERFLVAQRHLGERIAHHRDVDAGALEDDRGGEVVAGDLDDLGIAPLAGDDLGDGDPGSAHADSTRAMSPVSVRVSSR
jgi:hypothetical protein